MDLENIAASGIKAGIHVLLDGRDVQELVLHAVVIAVDGDGGKGKQQKQKRVAKSAMVG